MAVEAGPSICKAPPQSLPAGYVTRSLQRQQNNATADPVLLPSLVCAMLWRSSLNLVKAHTLVKSHAVSVCCMTKSCVKIQQR